MFVSALKTSGAPVDTPKASGLVLSASKREPIKAV
jgi:hypothetical protein